MTEEKENSNKKKPLVLWFIIFLLTITNCLTIWFLLKEQGKVVEQKTISETIIVERDNVRSDLLSLKEDYNEIVAKDSVMQKKIDEQKARIEELIIEAEKHKGDAYTISKLRKETETLRAIMKGFVRTIDSLNTLNQTLVAEKKTVLKQLSAEKEKQNTLIKEKDELKSTIEKGSILTCFNISAKAVLFKKGGKKEVETTKASKTEKIKISFSLGENKIAKPGEKTVYIRIITPDGKELAKSYDDNYKFTFNKSSGYYAGKETLNYANTEITGVTYCEGQGEFVSGNYTIEITCDGVVIGSSSIKLN
jgi:hypothetical protein